MLVVAGTAGQTPADPLALAREALGGDAALSAVKSFRLSGELTRTLTLGGIWSSTVNSVEYNGVFPAQFVRRLRLTISPNGPSSTVYEGFTGTDPIRETQGLP